MLLGPLSHHFSDGADSGILASPLFLGCELLERPLDFTASPHLGLFGSAWSGRGQRLHMGDERVGQKVLDVRSSFGTEAAGNRSRDFLQPLLLDANNCNFGEASPEAFGNVADFVVNRRGNRNLARDNLTASL